MTAERTLSFLVPGEVQHFTGERFTTAMTGGIDHEHRHRYLVAAGLCAGKRVLDVASGEGYGSGLLATVAADVVGVDVDPATIAHARQTYQRDNLRFVASSATSLPLGDGTIDVVVSFETVEHFTEHDAFMAEIRRVLVPGGLLVMSSPIKGVYFENDANHFHLRELTRDEFVNYISAAFKHTRFFEQKALMGSVIAATRGISGAGLGHKRLDENSFDQRGFALVDSPYLIAIASDAMLPDSFDLAILDDTGYVEKMGRVIAYNEYLLREKQKEQAELGVEIENLRGEIGGLRGEIGGLHHELHEARAENERLVAERLQADQDRVVELARLRSDTSALARSLRESEKRLRVKEAEAADLPRFAEELAKRDAHLNAVYRSTSWRITRPIRGISRVARFVGAAALPYVRRHGVGGSIAALLDLSKWHRLVWLEQQATSPQASMPGPTPEAKPQAALVSALPAAVPAGRIAPHVVIVAELSIAQCAKYRVWQKKAQIEGLGIACTVVEWWQKEAVRDALQTATCAIFYRAPGYAELLDLVAEARRLHIATYWEVDDLIFDEDAYKANGNLARLDPKLRSEVLAGVPLYRAALQACEFGLASTAVLAEEMRKAGVKAAYVVENALDVETLDVAARVYRERVARAQREEVSIVYGSGSKSHIKDFEEAAGAIARLMELRPHVTLQVLGDLEPPERFAAFGARVRHRDFVPFKDYLPLLGENDISIAPLEPGRFNDAKSNIKYLEAAVLAIPSVCSPRAAFADAIQHGVTGVLADGEAAWLDALLALVDDAALRRQIGEAAREGVLARYAPDAVAKQQVLPALQATQAISEQAHALRILQTNIFFAPKSFGGATIVAEEVSERLAKMPGVEVMVCAASPETLPEAAVQRHMARGLTCFGLGLPPAMNREQEYRNTNMQAAFARVLAASRPDVVHLHSIQGLSATIALACREAGIPYVVTLHDVWWLCERQFMIKADGRYCFNTSINPEICASCVPDPAFNRDRSDYLREILNGAALILTPSAFHRELHLQNGFPPEKVVVNKNGILKPAKAVRRPIDGRVRFGFVGGWGIVKGSDLIVRALNELEHTNYSLIVVDNTENLGFSSMREEDWRVPGELRITPAYTRDTMDSFFNAIDVLLFPTQCKESFGLTVREALARNVWVIATDAGGAAEDIIPGVNGDVLPLTPDSDHAPLREALRNLLDAPAKLDRLANPNTDAIVSFDQQAAELLEILRRIVASSQSKSSLQ